jgi:hypothetical protein
MARNEKRRAKALAKRKAKKKKANRCSSDREVVSARAVIRHSREYPIRECAVATGASDSGLHQLLLARDVPDGQVVFGVFLVDAFCLGVKNVTCNVLPRWRYDQELRPQLAETGPIVPIDLTHFHQFLYGALDFARGLGFEPQRDFRLGQYILEPREKFPANPDLTFGWNGTPFYMSGPHDNPSAILATLDRTVGAGNYYYMLGEGGQNAHLPPDSSDGAEFPHRSFP